MVNKVISTKGAPSTTHRAMTLKDYFQRAPKRLLSECAHERALLQALIDMVSDHPWVRMSAFFIAAKKAIVADSGRSHSRDMIGLSDFDIHPRERAQVFHDVEQTSFAATIHYATSRRS